MFGLLRADGIDVFVTRIRRAHVPVALTHCMRDRISMNSPDSSATRPVQPSRT